MKNSYAATEEKVIIVVHILTSFITTLLPFAFGEN